MVCACIDIGTNTTRLLVADVAHGRARTLTEAKAFCRLGHDVRAAGAVTEATAQRLLEVVATQREIAGLAGAQHVRVVATAVLRRAENGPALLERVGDAELLAAEEEARLAFVGATETAERVPSAGTVVGVVDVGGGSTELAVGTRAGGVTWSASVPVGSGELADLCRADPPGAAELAQVRARMGAALRDVRPPAVERAIAVGGSAASLRTVTGDVLEPDSLSRALRTLAAGPAAEVAARHDLLPERVRLLPAGILALDAARARLGRPLEIGCGGIREGIVLELGAAAQRAAARRRPR